jgi:hypothetical protein
MKTDDLISMLANGAEAVAPRALQRHYWTALGLGAFGAGLLMASWLGVRPDLVEAAALPMFWVKLMFPALMLAGALMAVLRLSRPGVRLGRVSAVIAAPVLAMWLLGGIVLLGALPAARTALVLGVSWSVCPFYIAGLSVPAFIAVFWAMKRLAPTRFALAGAAAGLLSGALGALVYALHCPEITAPFLGTWYLIGMLIPAVVGALAGPRLLRW